MRILALALIVIGILAFAYKGISYTRDRSVIDVGPLKASVEERKTIPIAPLLGGLALAAGVGMLVMNRRRA